METQKKDSRNKPLCEEDGCPSILDESIVIGPYIDGFINLQIKNNPNANPLCIKRIISKLLSEESARLFVELIEYEESVKKQ